MSQIIDTIKKIISLIVGVPILIIGIVLIPLPGPGVLLTILGLFILSFGFESVKGILERYKLKLVAIYRVAKKRYDRFVKKHDL